MGFRPVEVRACVFNICHLRKQWLKGSETHSSDNVRDKLQSFAQCASKAFIVRWDENDVMSKHIGTFGIQLICHTQECALTNSVLLDVHNCWRSLRRERSGLDP